MTNWGSAETVVDLSEDEGVRKSQEAVVIWRTSVA